MLQICTEINLIVRGEKEKCTSNHAVYRTSNQELNITTNLKFIPPERNKKNGSKLFPGYIM